MPEVAFSPTSKRFSNADPEMVQLIVDKYQDLDLNKDGMLNFKEVAELLRQGDETMTDKEIRSLFNTIDNNGTGRIDLQEFTSYVFDIQPEGTDRQQKIEEMKAKSREYEREVQQVEIFGATLNPELCGFYNMEYGKTLNGYPVFDRGYPEATIFYGFTEGKKLEGWFCAKRAPAEGKAAIRYKMFNPSLYAGTPNLCAACWESASRQRDKRMVVSPIDNEEWDTGNTEGFARGVEYFGNAEEEAQEEAEEHEAKFGEDYELDEGNPDEAGDWDSEWYDQAGEGRNDMDDDAEHAYENDGDDAQEEEDDPCDDFTDPEFPPEESSLGSKEFGHNGWTRLSQVHDQACILKVVGPEDVVHGGDHGGNFWFLSAMACVAEYPAWIQSMFSITKSKLPGDHKYSVRLYHPGKKQFMRVEVDDFVPTRDGSPVLAGVFLQGEIWPALIEKAFAKLCKSYKQAGWGSVAYGLLYLCGGAGAENWTKKQRNVWGRSYTKWTGKANETVDRKRAEGVVTDGIEVGQATLWLVLQQYLEMCYPMCATANGSKCKKVGLQGDRAYSVIASQEVQCDGGTIRLLRMRNSWGDSELTWNGRWSDDSDAWVDCPAAFHSCKFRRSEGNTFWMSYNDFLKYFDVVDVVKKSMPIQGCKYSKIDDFKTGMHKYGSGYY